MSPKIKPLYGNVLLKLLDIDDLKPKKKIVLVQETNKGLVYASVVAVGCGVIDEDGFTLPLRVRVGDKVLLNKFIGAKVGSDHLIVEESKLLGIVKQ